MKTVAFSYSLFKTLITALQSQILNNYLLIWKSYKIDTAQERISFNYELLRLHSILCNGLKTTCNCFLSHHIKPHKGGEKNMYL